MKKIYSIFALICAASAFVSCIEENFESGVPAQSGDQIVFGVRAGFENAA